MYYYGGDNKLRVLDVRARNGGYSLTNSTGGTFEEYRYDALGRRVWVRARRDSGCGSGCYSYIERTVWDGDQVLYEIRAPGSDNVTSSDLERDTGILPYYSKFPYGRVAYTHGPGIDAPVSVIRMEYNNIFSGPIAVAPHTSWRNVFDIGTFSDGNVNKCDGLGNCVNIDWPEQNWTIFMAPKEPRDPSSWFGNLIQGKRDGSGQFYMRNRYYDAKRGRFTQEDPIGLAGGLNLYGYAGGDPVNFSDPFGLCPSCRNELSSRTIDEEVKFQQALTPRDRVALVGAAVGAAAVGFAVMAGTSALMAAAPLAAAAPGVTSRMVGALERAGPQMGSRINAVAGQLKASNIKGHMSTNAETGVVTFRGGAGSRAREIILNPDGSSVVRAFDPTKEAWKTVKEIRPQ